MTDKISIVIASFDGADTLPRCFASLEAQPSDFDVEYILVDNASRDETFTLMEGFAAKHHGLALKEPRRGKSFALNTAISRLSGDLILFLDDDVIPHKGWLSEYVLASESMPEVALFAGALRPCWPSKPAAWQAYLAEQGRSFGCTQADRKTGPCTYRSLKGGNFAVRKTAMEGRIFDVGVSNYGSTKMATGGEDTELAMQISADGQQLVFLKNACADHIIRADEMNVAAIVSRYRRIGRGTAARRNNPLLLLFTPIVMIGFSVLAAALWVIGKKQHAAVNLTRAASRLGRLEFLILRRGQ